MYSANSTVEYIDRIIDQMLTAYGFQCETIGFSISQAKIASVFQEEECQDISVSDGTSVLCGTTKYGEGIYLSDLGAKKSGGWIVLWQAAKPLEEEICSRRFYMLSQEREEEAELTIYGVEEYKLWGGQWEAYIAGAMRFDINVGDVWATSEAGQLLRGTYPASELTVFLDISHKWEYLTLEGGPALNRLQVGGGIEEQALPVSIELSEKELLDFWDRYLEEHWDELEDKYKGKYVAIWQDTVYDSDIDLAALAERVYSTLGYHPIFMPYIGKHRGVADFLSPI